jgi:phosphopantothenoylcysteine synthetase/decarboxylase
MNILFSVCGSISAYKALDIARGFIKDGHDVKVVLTKEDTLSKTLTIVSVIAAFTPVVFPYHWGKVAEEQQQYKWKIYAPISMNYGEGEIAPGLLLTYNF